MRNAKLKEAASTSSAGPEVLKDWTEVDTSDNTRRYFDSIDLDGVVLQIRKGVVRDTSAYTNTPFHIGFFNDEGGEVAGDGWLTMALYNGENKTETREYGLLMTASSRELAFDLDVDFTKNVSSNGTEVLCYRAEINKIDFYDDGRIFKGTSVGIARGAVSGFFIDTDFSLVSFEYRFIKK